VPKLVKDFFTLVHTQSNVSYTITGFRSKNKDEISAELSNVIQKSSNACIVDFMTVFYKVE